MTNSLYEYISYKHWLKTIVEWDMWQFAIRSHFFKNPLSENNE